MQFFLETFTLLAALAGVYGMIFFSCALLDSCLP